jgi:hypothetical protein
MTTNVANSTIHEPNLRKARHLEHMVNASPLYEKTRPANRRHSPRVAQRLDEWNLELTKAFEKHLPPGNRTSAASKAVRVGESVSRRDRTAIARDFVRTFCGASSKS